MLGFLVFIMGISTVWIMVVLYGRVAELERCTSALCNALDELRVEVIEAESDGQK